VLVVMLTAAQLIHRAVIVLTGGLEGADWLMLLTTSVLTAAHTFYVLIMCLRPATQAFFSSRGSGLDAVVV